MPVLYNFIVVVSAGRVCVITSHFCSYNSPRCIFSQLKQSRKKPRTPIQNSFHTIWVQQQSSEINILYLLHHCLVRRTKEEIANKPVIYILDGDVYFPEVFCSFLQLRTGGGKITAVHSQLSQSSRLLCQQTRISTTLSLQMPKVWN